MLPEDDFTRWLREAGSIPTVYQPAGFLGAPPIGWVLPVGKSRFVYRVEETPPGRLIIVLFERQTGRAGLRSPFADFVSFLRLVQRSGVAVQFIEGRVDALAGRPADSLESTQIGRFYQRHLAAWPVSRDADGVEWFAGDLHRFLPPLRAHRSTNAPQKAEPPDTSARV